MILRACFRTRGVRVRLGAVCMYMVYRLLEFPRFVNVFEDPEYFRRATLSKRMMRLTNNTILITGGGTGIGRGLAEAFHNLGNEVIIAGRRKEPLAQTAAANPGMRHELLDVQDPADVRRFASKIVQRYPALNVVIPNAGMMKAEDLKTGDVSVAEETIATNLLGPIRLVAEFAPHLLKQANAAILTVTSGLAFVPLFLTPTYSATKAAVHSWTQSLRFQLRGTSVQVIEIAPPYVQTELFSPSQASDPHAMPLSEFVSEVMQILKATPDVREVLVERVKAQRFAEASGNYQEFYDRFNEMRAADLATRAKA